ncbi:MAG: DUF2272 domain-containing protein [Lachnospiraceae bacterium]|nr:DUF2272 domain-containing protein [Lachnospiraceae bacterium]
MKQMKRKTALLLAVVMLWCTWLSGSVPVVAAEGIPHVESTTEQAGENAPGTEKTGTEEETETIEESETVTESDIAQETETDDETESIVETEETKETESENPEETTGMEDNTETPEETESGEETERGTDEAFMELYGAGAPSVFYSVHMQSYGWLAESANGAENGKTGIGKRLEAIKVRVSGVSGLGVSYQVYRDDHKWYFGQDGSEAGTTGVAKRVEAVKMSLTGATAGQYDIYYRVYANGHGWLDWAKNGAEAGLDSSWNKSIEAVQIVVKAKGSAAPGPTAKPYLSGQLEAEYPNTHTNTGNKITDMIAIAKTQVGYYKPGDTPTKYGTWYNRYVNAAGDYYPSAPWCAMFVSWCANQAGISSTVFRMNASTVNMAIWYQNSNNPGTWHDRGTYTPQAGDLIFFKFDWNNNYVNHVGIVTGVSGGTVYTVEGNTSDSVAERKYALDNTYIKGYATPDYYGTGVIEPPVDAKVSYLANVEGKGWVGWKYDGGQAGTTGSAKMLKALRIQVSNKEASGGVTYRTHMQSYGWQPWVSNGAVSGIVDKEKRMEAVEIKLTGNLADKYDIYYRVHSQSYGWLDWAKNGETAGTEGYAKRVEAIEIRLVAKGGAVPGKTTRPFVKRPAGVSYSTHCQTYGWLPSTSDGVMNGTQGQSKRLEGIKINLDHVSGSVSYRTHVQTYGWKQGWVYNGAVSGTTGQSKRLEAIEIKLSGEAAVQYDIYYRVHSQTYGWMGWAKNGEPAGTSGQSKRLEAIEIKLVPKGGKAPGSTARHYIAS